MKKILLITLLFLSVSSHSFREKPYLKLDNRQSPPALFYKNAKSKDVSFIKKVNQVGEVEVSREIPLINDIPVDGADIIRVKSQNNGYWYYYHFNHPKRTFKLTADEAIKIAEKFLAHKNPKFSDEKPIYEKIWLLHFDELKPAYKVRLPALTVFDLKDVYVDGNNGNVLKIENSADFFRSEGRLDPQSPPIYAKVFQYSPPSSTFVEEDLYTVRLIDVDNVKENEPLKSNLIQVRNCCQYYTCPNGKSECELKERQCALREHKDALTTRHQLELATNSLGVDPSFGLPSHLFFDSVKCTYLPVAKAYFNKGKLGFFEKPQDDFSEISQIDGFSEVQAHYLVVEFFQNIRKLLDNPNWCLRKEAMICDNKGRVALDTKGNPIAPYNVFVNQMVPDIQNTSWETKENILTQVQEGKGSKENPVVVDRFKRVNNAAFVPALSTVRKGIERADELLSGLITDFDHNVFFQGEQRDFAYDGDVVFHEFMHAVIATFLGKLNTFGIDRWGIHSETGGLNEGWADYFAATMTNDPLLGEYASKVEDFEETSLRNIKNDLSCPYDVVGEAHNDSQIWSGALWEIREKISKVMGKEKAVYFDKAVLLALVQAVKSESFAQASEKLLDAIEHQEAIMPDGKQIAEEVLTKRGVKKCFKAFPLTELLPNNDYVKAVKELTFMPSKNNIGLANYAPSPFLFQIDVPKGAKNIRIRWEQYFGGSGAIFNDETKITSQNNLKPLMGIFSLNEPIKWSFADSKALAHMGQKSKKFNEPQNKNISFYQDGFWNISKPLNSTSCQRQKIYFSLVASDLKYILKNIEVDFDMDPNFNPLKCQKKPQKGQSCHSLETSSLWLFGLIIALFIKLRNKV